MTCASSADSDAYYRCYKALHLVTIEAIPCVDNCLKVWHWNQNVGPCITGKCPQGKKPKAKAPASCHNCIDWGSTVEGMLFQPPAASTLSPGKSPSPTTQITWSNVNSSLLSQSHVEAAKAFVLRLPKIPPPSTQTTASTCPTTIHQPNTSIEDFDSASLLSIMTRFKHFHGGDLASYQIIQKVAEMRNKLSHMCLGEDMKIHNHQVSNYFKDLNSLVDCLNNLHPVHFNTAADIKTKLGAIELEPVTNTMRKEIHILMRWDIQALAQDTKSISETGQQTHKNIQKMSKNSKEQHQQTQEAVQHLSKDSDQQHQLMQEAVQGLSEDLQQQHQKTQDAVQRVVDELEKFKLTTGLNRDVPTSIETGNQPSSTNNQVSRHLMEPQLAGDVDVGLPQTAAVASSVMFQTPSSENFDLQQCQAELRYYYLNTMGKVNLLPWIPDATADMESIFVELELVKQETFQSAEQLQKIESNEDLTCLKSNQGERVNRVIVMGDAGSGKSTMAANIAYKWALQDPRSHLYKFSLVFLIRMHEVENDNASLVQLIFDQILSEDSKVSKEDLELFISNHAKDILVVIDGMDEDSFGLLQNKSSTVTKVVQNRLLRQCCVILCTRPHKVNEFGKHLAYYTQVRLNGFSEENISLYIQRFFRADKEIEKQILLVAKLNAEPHIKTMASIPVLLLMICLIWKDKCTLPNTKTKLYQATINHLWKRYKSKEGQVQTDDTSDDDEFEDELHSLIHTLGEAIVNSMDKHDGNVLFNEQELGAEAFSLGCRVGIISRERLRSRLKNKTLVTFLHTSFQDFCAGVYLAKLDPNDATFQHILGKLSQQSGGKFKDMFVCSPILDFCCGTGIQLNRVQIILQQMLNKQKGKDKTDITFHLSHIYESQLPYDEYLKIVPLYSSANHLQIKISQQTVPHVLYLLEMSESSTTEYSGLFSTLHDLYIDTSSILPHLPSILEYTTSLEDLDMFTNDSSIKTTDLTDTYKAIGTLPKLTKLWLQNDSDTSLDATDLLHMLSRSKPNEFEVFVLDGYQFNALAMAKFLVHSKSSLYLLILYGTLDASDQPTAGIDVVIKVLPDLNKLGALWLGRYKVPGAVEYLRPIVPRLDSLVLDNCALQEKDLLQLFSFLHTAQELIDVDLSHNAFSLSSVISLVGCLNEMPYLEILDLDSTGLNDESACILALCLKNKPMLSILYLRGNPSIGPKGRDALKGLPCVLLI